MTSVGLRLTQSNLLACDLSHMYNFRKLVLVFCSIDLLIHIN
jgi:hypothetical protein